MLDDLNAYLEPRVEWRLLWVRPVINRNPTLAPVPALSICPCKPAPMHVLYSADALHSDASAEQAVPFRPDHHQGASGGEPLYLMTSKLAVYCLLCIMVHQLQTPWP